MKSPLPAIAIAIALCLGATDVASAQSIKRSDFLSSDQIKQGYTLAVAGRGTVVLKSADAAGKTCLVRKDSLVKLIGALPPTAAGQVFVHMKSHTMSDGSLGCWGAGQGCKVIVIVGPPPAPDP